MKTQILLVAFLFGTHAQAQSNAHSNAIVVESADDTQASVASAMPKKRRLVQFDEATNSVVEVEAAPVVEQRQPIYILNNQRQAVQEQPTTLVEAAPLAESRAEAMRKKRQGLEVNTEQKIVEKLEEARMEDEKARAERLFGNGFGSGRAEPAAPAYVQPVPEPIPVVVAPPAPVQAVAPVVVEKEEEKIDVRSEIKAAMAELNESVDKKDKQTYFIGGVVGLAEYPDAVNVKGNVATGITVGMTTVERIVVEGSFLYSDYAVDDYSSYYPWKDLTQYNFAAAVKYQLLPGKFRPFAGGVVGCTYRKATERIANYAGYGTQTNNEGTSNAFDLGVAAGLDLQLTDSFAIGGEFRYLTNVSYRRDESIATPYSAAFSGHTPIEELDYYTVTFGGKFTF
ncbi:MAG: porin family protein [Bdellovibrionaceae bacterium]|nr:porin family protein [Pseudobdellovibrionaceae bacterium]